MVREILQIGDKRLLQKSEAIDPKDIASSELQQLIDDLIHTCNQDPDGSAGLSAVQIGMLKRVFIARRIDLESEIEDSEPLWEPMINPKVELLTEDLSEAWEGCLSVGTGDNRLFGPVQRAAKVRVSYTDRNGKPQTLECENYMAHIVQHELDHLEGILFLKYIANPANIWKSKDLDDYIQQHGTYPDTVE